MKKKKPTEFPQDKIDLQFWQYMSGVVDAINQDNQFIKINEERIEVLMRLKLARIANAYNDRKPSFTLCVGYIPNKKEFTLTKELLP